MDSPRPVLLTKASEPGRQIRPASAERPMSSAERPITVMRKDETMVLPTIETAAELGPASRKQLKEHGLLPQTMSRPCPLLNENLQMMDTAISWLGEGTEYLVVGVVGRQGVGKSTVMSMLGGQAPFCHLKKYMFPPETLQQVLNSEHRTNGVEMLVTPQKVILLDTQPILSPSIIDLLAQGDRKLPGDSGSLETQMELLALQQLAFLYTICHVVLVVQDWFVDGDLIRLLQTAEMLKPAASTSSADEPPTEHYPRLVFVHNRCTLSHFQPHGVRQMQEFYRSAFGGSGLVVSSGVGVGTGDVIGQARPDVTGEPVNVLLLPEFTPAEEGVAEEEYEGPLRTAPSGHWGLARLVEALRTEVFRLPQSPLTHQQVSLRGPDVGQRAQELVLPRVQPTGDVTGAAAAAGGARCGRRGRRRAAGLTQQLPGVSEDETFGVTPLSKAAENCADVLRDGREERGRQQVQLRPGGALAGGGGALSGPSCVCVDRVGDRSGPSVGRTDCSASCAVGARIAQRRLEALRRLLRAFGMSLVCQAVIVNIKPLPTSYQFVLQYVPVAFYRITSLS